MQSTVSLEKFEGPLDVLLRLIEEQKMPITEISLASVTEQFLHHLDTLEEERPQALADFLVIASRLVYLKSKTLLPYLYPEPDEGPSLADQLKLYKQYLDASKDLLVLWQAERIAYGRVEPPITVSQSFVMPKRVGTTELERSFLILLRKLKPAQPLPQMHIDRSVSVKQRITSLYESIKQAKQLRFDTFTQAAQSKTEVIVSFLALLELVRDARVQFDQTQAFDHLVITLVR